METSSEDGSWWGEDGILRTAFPTVRVRSALESNNAWLAAFLVGCAVAVWQILAGGVPDWGLRLAIGAGIGGSAGFCISSFRIWRAGKHYAEVNKREAERLIAEIACAGIPARAQARGCVVIQDTHFGAIDGLIADPQSGRLALLGSGHWSECRYGDLEESASNRPGWSAVRLRGAPEIVAVLPQGVAAKMAGVT